MHFKESYNGITRDDIINYLFFVTAIYICKKYVLVVVKLFMAAYFHIFIDSLS